MKSLQVRKRQFTGEKQAKSGAGRGGNVPPVNRRFGQPGGNPQNKKGRISTRPDLVAAIERAANMKLFDDRGKPLILDGEQVTRLDAVIRTAFTGRTSSDKRFLIWLLEFWHGKPVQPVDVTSKGEKLTIEIIKASNDKRADSD